MYVAKFDREGILWRVTVFEKEWSNLMYTHEVSEIATKRFVFHNSGYRWINKEVSRNLFEKHRLEIING